MLGGMTVLSVMGVFGSYVVGMSGIVSVINIGCKLGCVGSRLCGSGCCVVCDVFASGVVVCDD